MVIGTIKGNTVYKFNREELKNKSAEEFKNGDIVICNKYHIQITYGEYDVPSLCTTVSTREDLRNLPLHKQPYFIKDFISRRIKDLK